jgi:hypothetical protein
MTDDRTVTVTLQLTEAEAWELAQMAKRLGWSDWRSMSVDDAEAYVMRDATDRLAAGLREAGYAPR